MWGPRPNENAPFELYAKTIHSEDEVMVDDGVQQGVGQIVAPHLADLAAAGKQPGAHGVEHVAWSLLERQDVAFPNDEA